MASSSQVRQSRREALEAQRLALAKKERRNRILLVVAGVVVFAVVIGLAAWGFISTSTKGGTEVPPNANAEGNGILLAAEKESVPTLEVYTDYNCPGCASAHLTLNTLITQLVENGELNVVSRSLIGQGATSRSAAIAAACADYQGAYAAYDTQLFLNQSVGFDSTTLLDTIPTTLGFTSEQISEFEACYNSSATGGFVDDVAAYAAREGIGSTPSFFFDGEPVSLTNPVTGAIDADILRELLAE